MHKIGEIRCVGNVFEDAMHVLEQSIITSLRAMDAGTKYSNSQYIVILMDTDMENGKNITGGVKIDRPDSTRWACGAKMMTKADYTKATGLNEGGRLVGENAAGESMYFGDNTFHGVRLLNGHIGCAGEYVLVYGCRK